MLILGHLPIKLWSLLIFKYGSHFKLYNINLFKCHSFSYIPNPRKGRSQCKTHCLLSRFLPYITSSSIIINHQIIQTTHSHASQFHYCNVDFMLFHNVTCYTISLLSSIRVHTTKLLNITCTLITTSMRLWTLECTTYTKRRVTIVFNC